MNDREYRLGQDVARLGRRIYAQRLRIKELSGLIPCQIDKLAVEVQLVSRQNIMLKEQNNKLIIENRELRLLLLQFKRENG